MGSGGTGVAGYASAKSAWTWLRHAAAALCRRGMAQAWDVMVVFLILFVTVCFLWDTSMPFMHGITAV